MVGESGSVRATTAVFGTRARGGAVVVERGGDVMK
jgi:hypothetical protein